MFNFKIKMYSTFVVIFIVDFYGLVSSDLPTVPNTVVVPPGGAPPPKPLQPLSIYYDAMEENSQVFFNTTLVKKIACYSSYVNFSFIPCQQAKKQKKKWYAMFVPKARETKLICNAKADPSCTLDKIHSCAIAQSTNQVQLVQFLACTMSSVETLPDISKCATQNKIDDKQLMSCATSKTGVSLCKDYSEQPKPDPTPMPGFFFRNPNDVHHKDTFEHLDFFENDLCVNDFTSAVCAHLKTTNATARPDECNKKLLLGIFYKAMGCDSQKWFQKFAKEYKQFSNYLTIKYEPCMFAELSDSGELDCKNSADTNCIAAKTHACAISIITDQILLFQFLNCAMQDATKLPDFNKCATDNKIPYEPIKSCAESDKGKQLCYDYSKTRPNADESPMFSYELTFDTDVSDATFQATSLKTMFCDQMKKYGITKPHVCA